MRDEQRIRTSHKSGDSWWYEETYGISICDKQLNGYIKIKWNDLKFALKRHDKIKNKFNKLLTKQCVKPTDYEFCPYCFGSFSFNGLNKYFICPWCHKNVRENKNIS